MSFLHPEFLYLVPLAAIPILIHLLNRVRYRRMRWAAIDFLLATRQRAVRRARLRQILLMALRTLVLAAALGALAQPILSGSMASLLGDGTQVVVLLDASASMSAADASRCAFDRAKREAVTAMTALPRTARAGAGLFTTRCDWLFRDPIQDHAAVAATIEAADLTAGGTDVPGALRAAAESLTRNGGGGTIWLLTDLREAGWRTGGSGAWNEVRQALRLAGHPRVVITDVAPAIASNYSVARVVLTPDLLVEGDVPGVTVRVAHEGSPGATRVGLYFDGRLVDTRPVEFTGPGTADVMFHLPVLKEGLYAAWVELERDSIPGDDRYFFLIRPTHGRPVLLVDGAPSGVAFEGASDFLAAALHPAPAEGSVRSPFSVKVISAGELAGTALGDYAAVCLADVPRLNPAAAESLRAYVAAGGLAMVFPGLHTDPAAWNEAVLPGVRMESAVQADGDKRMTINWTSPASPVTATLAAEGLDRVTVARQFRLTVEPPGEVLATTDGGGPLLVQAPFGKGKIYIFAVSCQPDASNLPLTPVFLLATHRAIRSHLADVSEPLCWPAMTRLEFPLQPGKHRVLTPQGKSLPLAFQEDQPGKATFAGTDCAGIYQVVAEEAAPGEAVAGIPVAAVNAPPEESSLARIDPREVRGLLEGSSVHFLEPDHVGRLDADPGVRSAASGFPFAVAAILLLIAEVVTAWSMSRTGSGQREVSLPGAGPATR